MLAPSVFFSVFASSREAKVGPTLSAVVNTVVSAGAKTEVVVCNSGDVTSELSSSGFPRVSSAHILVWFSKIRLGQRHSCEAESDAYSHIVMEL